MKIHMYKWLLLLPLIGSGVKANSQVQTPFQYIGGSASWDYLLNQNNSWDVDIPIPAGFPPAQCVATAQHANGTTLIVYGFPYYRIPGTAVRPGAVYVCVKSSLSPAFYSQTLITGDNDGDEFGYSVAMDQTGNLIAVGAPSDNNYLYMNGKNPSQGYIPGQVKSSAGAVYILGSPYQNMAYSIRKKVCAPLTTNARNAGDLFGVSVGISCSWSGSAYYNLELLVGSFGQDYDASGSSYLSASGAAYYSRYYLSSSSNYLDWNLSSFQTLSQKVTAAQRSSLAAFGFTLAMSSGTLSGHYVVGAPNENSFAGAAYLFSKGSTTAIKRFNSVGVRNYAGASVAINSDFVAIGIPGADDAGLTDCGRVDVYDLTRMINKEVFAPASRKACYGYFGRSVALSDNNRLAATGVSDLRLCTGNYTSSNTIAPIARLFLLEISRGGNNQSPQTNVNYKREIPTYYNNGEEFLSDVAVSNTTTVAAFPSNAGYAKKVLRGSGLVVYQSSNGYEPNQGDQEKEEESSTQGNTSFSLLNEMKSQPVTISSTGSEVLVNGAGLEGRQWVIYSINGQQQSSGQLGELQGDFHRVSLNTLTPGVYVFQVAGTNVSAKIVKQ